MTKAGCECKLQNLACSFGGAETAQTRLGLEQLRAYSWSPDFIEDQVSFCWLAYGGWIPLRQN